MLKDKGRLIIQRSSNRAHPGEQIISRCFIYLPTTVTRDSQFPFHGNQAVHVEVRDGKIFITKVTAESTINSGH